MILHDVHVCLHLSTKHENYAPLQLMKHLHGLVNGLSGFNKVEVQMAIRLPSN